MIPSESSGLKESSSQSSSINAPSISLKRSYNQPRASLPNGTGVLRHRAHFPLLASKPEDKVIVNPEMSEVLARFMVSQGIPFECINEGAFRDMLLYFTQGQLPTPKVLEAIAEKNGAPGKPKVSFSKAIGPLSVTVDTVKDGDDNYLVFSIHYFEDFYTREHAVFLRKLMLNEIDKDSIVICIRRAVSAYNYANVKFSNILVPNWEIASLIDNTDSMKRDYVCFFDYVSRFVNLLLEIPEFDLVLEHLRSFVSFIRTRPDLYGKFRRTQLTKNDELDLPSIEKGSWLSTFTFLTRCLVLNETFREFVFRCNLSKYITSEMFNILLFFQRILKECAKYCRNLSVPLNSISQVIPTVMLLRNFITAHTNGFGFEKVIRECFNKVFRDITHGKRCERYDIAAFLDPRYAYKDTIYTHATWKNIEQKLIEEVVKTQEPSSERMFVIGFTRLRREEKVAIITAELNKYRQCLSNRPDEHGDPFYWWGLRQTSMENLTILAVEYLACPAISIDAKHFFGDKGKLNRLCKAYNYQNLENCLNFSGYCQQYQGRGNFCDRNTPCSSGGLDRFLFNDSLKYEKTTSIEVVPILALQRSSSEEVNAELQDNENRVEDAKIPDSTLIEKEVKEEEVEVHEKRPALPRPMIIRIAQPGRTRITVIPARTTALPRVAVFNESLIDSKKFESSSCEMFDSDEIKKEPIDESMDESCFPHEIIKCSRKSNNRRCTLCHCLEPLEKLKNVTVDVEKMLLLFGAVRREELTIAEAQACFHRKTKSYYCRVHLTEASDDILSCLGVKSPYGVPDAVYLKIAIISETISLIRGREIAELRAHLVSFTSKYFEPGLFSVDSRSFNIDDSDKIESVREDIIPKTEREPRKQVLEDQGDAMILQIEEEPFELPDQPVDDEDLDETAEICCFCLARRNRYGMVKIPNSPERRSRWVHKLGTKFAERLKSGDNYLCREHFESKSFSSRGRLLKGMLPVTEGESVKVTYKIDGANILKLHESKKGTDRSPTIDLTVQTSPIQTKRRK